MTSSNFQEATITSQTVLPLVNEIVLHHQPTFEQFSQLSLQRILVEELDTDSYFSRTKKGMDAIMHAWSHSGVIKVNKDYFNATNATLSSEQQLEQSAFLEYITLHEMSHLAFCKKDFLNDAYQQLFLLEPHGQFTSLLEAFANALAITYLQKQYKKHAALPRSEFFLETFLPDQHDRYAQTPHFSELYTALRKKSLQTFYQEAASMSQDIFAYHFRKAELQEQAAQSQSLPKQLVMDF